MMGPETRETAMEEERTLEDAIQLAVQAHRGQVEKAGQPYSLHVLRVMLALEGDTARMAGVLHDVVEDTPYTLEQLREMGYPSVVLEALNCLTRRSGETYGAFIERIKPNPLARRVKIADLEDNMDLRRLPTVREKDLERLKRYREAWGELKSLENR